jgi:hypothetical protein
VSTLGWPAQNKTHLHIDSPTLFLKLFYGSPLSAPLLNLLCCCSWVLSTTSASTLSTVMRATGPATWAPSPTTTHTWHSPSSSWTHSGTLSSTCMVQDRVLPHMLVVQQATVQVQSTGSHPWHWPVPVRLCLRDDSCGVPKIIDRSMANQVPKVP